MEARDMRSRFCIAPLLSLCVTCTATADWNPAAGQWGKTDALDVRVMSFNIQDGICRNADKSEGIGSWHALARITAAMRPDVLVLVEAGDNSGNGSSGGLDSVEQLTLTLNLFLHGGTDPYLPGGPVGAYVQKYAPDFDLPYVFVSSSNDNFNRNVLLSRFPFVDLNGDTFSTKSDISPLQPDEYAPGGNGGIRGFLFCEIDLPDDAYLGDLVTGGAHLKSGSDQSDKDQRERAAQNVAYYVDYLLNGAGTGIPDPHNKIVDVPPATTILAPETPVLLCGDWNEDELTNGRKGPAEWLTMALSAGGADGTDRDRTDSYYDDARNPYNNSRGTYGTGTSKLDYIAWQDSIALLRRAFILYTSAGLPPAWYPPEFTGYFSIPALSGIASDHRPVVADFILPLAPTWQLGDMNCDGAVDFGDINAFVLALSNPGAYEAAYPGCPSTNGDLDGNGSLDFSDINPFVTLLSNP
jgi:endonuclease/exonuclease/phosphatase family metal-dependent hydrolase